jgi:hypothetical protein
LPDGVSGIFLRTGLDWQHQIDLAKQISFNKRGGCLQIWGDLCTSGRLPRRSFGQIQSWRGSAVRRIEWRQVIHNMKKERQVVTESATQISDVPLMELWG